MKKAYIISAVVIVILILMALVFDWGRRGSETIGADNSVTGTSSLPIILTYPKDNQEVRSPIKITGKARGTWFFEGSFPINLIDSNGNIIASSIATSTEDWMTSDFINFSSEISFVRPTSTTHALLVLKKDNPSDNPDLDQSIFVPVILK
jgi:hypothetical protein